MVDPNDFPDEISQSDTPTVMAHIEDENLPPVGLWPNPWVPPPPGPLPPLPNVSFDEWLNEAMNQSIYYGGALCRLPYHDGYGYPDENGVAHPTLPPGYYNNPAL